MPAVNAIQLDLYIRGRLIRHKEYQAERKQKTNNYWLEHELPQRMKKEKAKLAALDRAQGMTVAEIAQKYRITASTVAERIRFAEQQGLLDQHVSMVVKQLVPQAMGVYELAMSDLYHEVSPQVVSVATRVLEGTGVLRKPGAAAPSGGEGEVSTIEEYRALRITRQSAAEESHDASRGSGQSGWGTVLDADQADPGGDLDRHLPQLSEGGNGGSENPAGGDPEDQGRGR